LIKYCEDEGKELNPFLAFPFIPIPKNQKKIKNKEERKKIIFEFKADI
jgi:hypothetical protein